MKLLQIRRNATCEIGQASGYEKKDNVIENIEACTCVCVCVCVGSPVSHIPGSKQADIPYSGK